MLLVMILSLLTSSKRHNSASKLTSRKLKSDRFEYGKVRRMRFDMGGATMATVDSTICATSEAAWL